MPIQYPATMELDAIKIFDAKPLFDLMSNDGDDPCDTSRIEDSSAQSKGIFQQPGR